MGQRIEKWTGWIDGQIKNEIMSMHLHLDTWEQVQELIKNNGQLPDSYWWEFMRDTYGATQAVAVRRQADTHRDVASLGKLIAEISDDVTGLTREFWFELWSWPPDDPNKVFHVEQGWRDQFDPNDLGHLDPSIPASDLGELRAASEKVTDYVDRHLAHSDRRPLPAASLPTLDDVHDAVEKIGGLYKRYYNLLTASSWAFLVPVIQHDWKAVFREPWIRSSEGR